MFFNDSIHDKSSILHRIDPIALLYRLTNYWGINITKQYKVSFSLSLLVNWYIVQSLKPVEMGIYSLLLKYILFRKPGKFKILTILKPAQLQECSMRTWIKFLVRGSLNVKIVPYVIVKQSF